MKKLFIKFNEKLIVLENVLIAILSMIILISIFSQVVCRYLLYISTPWAEEIARYMFVCLAYIGSGIGIYHSQFVSVDLVAKILEMKSKNPERSIRILEKISISFIILFLVLFGYFYLEYLQNIVQLKPLAVVTKIPMFYPMSSIIIGVFFMLIHSICLFITSKEERQGVADEMQAKKEGRKLNKIRKVVSG